MGAVVNSFSSFSITLPHVAARKRKPRAEFKLMSLQFLTSCQPSMHPSAFRGRCWQLLDSLQLRTNTLPLLLWQTWESNRRSIPIVGIQKALLGARANCEGIWEVLGLQMIRNVLHSNTPARGTTTKLLGKGLVSTKEPSISDGLVAPWPWHFDLRLLLLFFFQ